MIELSFGVVEEEKRESRRFSLIAPPAEKFTRGREDLLFAADVFEPEKVVRRAKIFGYFLSALISIAPIYLTLALYKNGPSLRFAFGNLGLKELLVVEAIFAVLTLLFMSPWIADKLFLIYLKSKLAEKREVIDRNLYSALCMLSGFSKGNVPLTEAVALISKSKLDGVREEFSKIYAATSVYGSDFKSAAIRVALTTPSEKLSHFLKGLVGYLERKRDYSDYVDEFLLLDNVNRKVELSAYSEKLKNIAMVYSTIVVLMGISVIFIMASSVDKSMASPEPIVYVGLPLAAFSLTLLVHRGSPEKNARREKGKEATLLAAAVSVFVVLSVYLAHFFELSDLIKVLAVGVALVMAAVSYAYVRPSIVKDTRIMDELNEFIMRLYASSRAGENLLNAIRSGGAVDRELEEVVARSVSEPLGEVMLDVAGRIRHPFLSTAVYVLGAIMHRTRNYSDVLTGLLYEYHRYVELEKVKGSLLSMVGVFMLFCFLLMTFTMGVVKLQLIPLFEKMVDLSRGQVSVDTGSMVKVVDDTILMLGATIPFGLGALVGDLRKSFPYFLVTLSVALIFVALLGV